MTQQKRTRLAIFDLDGTLTPIESTWRYLHEALGTWNLGKVTAEQYWSGLIDYESWARLDAEAWRGVDLSRVEQILSEIPYREGVYDTIARLKRIGIEAGIVSAGLSLLADRAARDLGIGLVAANRLLHRDGRLTGEVDVEVSLENKLTAMCRMADQLGVTLKDCVAIGDTIYDLPSQIGLRIAFNPRDNGSWQVADAVVYKNDLRAILDYLT